MIKIYKKYLLVFLLVMKISIVSSIEQPDFSELADELIPSVVSVSVIISRVYFFYWRSERSSMSAFDCTRFRNVASSIGGDSSMSSRDTGISTYKWARATCLPVMAQWRLLGAFCSHQHPKAPQVPHGVPGTHTHRTGA